MGFHYILNPPRTYFKVLCRSLLKKSDRTRSWRCLAVSILEYNLGPKITGSEVQY